MLLVADVRRGADQAAADALLSTLDRLSQDGPSPQALRRVARTWRHRTTTVEAAAADAHALACATVLAVPTEDLTERVAQEAEALSPVTAAARLRPLLAEVELVVAPGVTLPEVWVEEDDDVDEEPLTGGRTYRATLPLVLGRPRTVVTEEGMSVRGHGRWLTVRWPEVVAVLQRDTWTEVVRRDGAAVMLHPDVMRKGRELEAEVRRRVPQHLQRVADPHEE